MKRSQFISSMIMLAMIGFGTTGCIIFEFDSDKPKTRTVTFTIAPALVEFRFYSISDPDFFKTENYMKLTDEKTNEVYALFPSSNIIDGFVFNEGYEYRVKVLLSLKYTDPVQEWIIPSEVALGTAYTYKLIKVLSKTKINN